MTVDSFPPNQRDILNKVMILLGSARRIDTAATDDSADASDLLALWDIARRAAIVLHPFNFAIKRQKTLRDTGTADDGGPLYRYTMPADCLRWLPWNRNENLWFDAVEEGGKLLSDDEGPVVIRYLVDVPNAALWSPLFCDVMAYTLAMEYNQAKTQLVSLRDRLASERQDMIDAAKRIDGLASANRQAGVTTINSRWAGARFRPNSPYGRNY